MQACLGFRGLGFRGLGFRGLGFRGLGFRDLGFRGLGFRGLGFRGSLRVGLGLCVVYGRFGMLVKGLGFVVFRVLGGYGASSFWLLLAAFRLFHFLDALFNHWQPVFRV